MHKPILSPDLSIAVLLGEWPQAIPVFLSHRMACVGCSMSPFETLRGAAEIYQLPFDRFLEEIREAVEDGGPRTKDPSTSLGTGSRQMTKDERPRTNDGR
jgi:hybrid cluster-associated redox disulfide protein